jgi:hypothetical protein
MDPFFDNTPRSTGPEEVNETLEKRGLELNLLYFLQKSKTFILFPLLSRPGSDLR